MTGLSSWIKDVQIHSAGWPDLPQPLPRWRSWQRAPWVVRLALLESPSHGSGQHVAHTREHTWHQALPGCAGPPCPRGNKAERVLTCSIPASQASHLPSHEEEQVTGKRGKLKGFPSLHLWSRSRSLSALGWDGNVKLGREQFLSLDRISS